MAKLTLPFAEVMDTPVFWLPPETVPVLNVTAPPVVLAILATLPALFTVTFPEYVRLGDPPETFTAMPPPSVIVPPPIFNVPVVVTKLRPFVPIAAPMVVLAAVSVMFSAAMFVSIVVPPLHVIVPLVEETVPELDAIVKPG